MRLWSRSRRERAILEAARARLIRSESASFDITRTSRPIAAPIARETRWKFERGGKKERAGDSRVEHATHRVSKPWLNPRNRAIHRSQVASTLFDRVARV
jgi:hypothetical protein